MQFGALRVPRSDTLVFLSGCHAAADVALRLVDFHDRLDLLIEIVVDVFQPFGEIFMYSAFADPKFLCSRADSGPVLYNVYCQIASTFLDT